MMEALQDQYASRYTGILLKIEPLLEDLLKGYLKEVKRIDRICVRAKSPESFLKKAVKLDTNGTPKYSDPLVQVQDQLGARVIVFFAADVVTVGDHLRQYFRNIEEKSIVPDKDSEFGYVGKHYISALPPDAVPREVELKQAPTFFELQIKTLFQHAWAEAEHDLGYKPEEPLTPDQRRRLAFTAAQAWGADHIFGELVGELSVHRS
jgi:putative GTP pyrophosphokinase